jgi:hypothetical protein
VIVIVVCKVCVVVPCDPLRCYTISQPYDGNISWPLFTCNSKQWAKDTCPDKIAFFVLMCCSWQQDCHIFPVLLEIDHQVVCGNAPVAYVKGQWFGDESHYVLLLCVSITFFTISFCVLSDLWNTTLFNGKSNNWYFFQFSSSTLWEYFVNALPSSFSNVMAQYLCTLALEKVLWVIYQTTIRFLSVPQWSKPTCFGLYQATSADQFVPTLKKLHS